MEAQQIIDLLINRGIVDKTIGEDVLDSVLQSGKTLIEVLIDHDILTEDEFYQHIADELNTSTYDLGSFEPTTELLGLVPKGMARLHQALPVDITSEGLFVCLADPLNPQTVEDLRFALGKEIIPLIASPETILKLIDEYYGADSEDMSSILELAESKENKEISAKDLEAEANSAPIIRYVDLVLFQAIKERASDIHFEPFEMDFKIRYRVDGGLYEMAPPPNHLANAITSRIKVMSNLNIAERRIPQDGRIMKSIDGKMVDMRVSTLPTQHGESVVLRVLDRSSVNLDIENLGMPDEVFTHINEVINRPNGIFIATGPTGAGKTTTLYAGLKKVNTIDSKLLTAEDPVEYDIDGIVQVPVNEAIGMTFARVLRAFLRQDPDRIMVGEMRDLETAQIAIQASLTGHLVFSTLHTNDAPGAVTRLLDMGCEPFLVAASLETILAQRLLRTICSKCKANYEPNEMILSQLGVSAHELGDKNFFTGKGCDSCNNTGYKGRKGLYEMLKISDPIRDLINKKAPTVVIKQKAIELGMTTLRDDGLSNIYDGTTTIEEVLKYT